MWEEKDCVMVDEPLRQGLKRIVELLAVLKNYYPVLEYIPVFNDSLPDILNVRSSIGPLDGYENIILAKYIFNGCVIDACIGSFAGDVPIWHLVEIKIEWHEQMLNISGGESVQVCFERPEISMLFSADELWRKKRSGEFFTENELAELEYYKYEAEEIIKRATQELRERIIWPENLLLNGGSNCSNLHEWL